MIKLRIIIILILSVFLLFTLSSCEILDDLFREESINNITDLQSQKIRNYTVLDFNKEELKLLFASKVQNDLSIDTQIDMLYQFINSYTDAVGDGIEPKEIGHHDCEINNDGNHYIIETAYTYKNEYLGEKKAYYLFTYYYCVENTDESLIGLHYLTFYLLNTKQCITIGSNEYSMVSNNKTS